MFTVQIQRRSTPQMVSARALIRMGHYVENAKKGLTAPSTAPIAWKHSAGALLCATLAACGGGGSGGETVQSIPAPPIGQPQPAPPPPPPPPPAGFDTEEFRFSEGPEFHGADVAWEADATGAGEIIAVIDSGIDSDSPEFSGRIHPDSQDVAGNRGITPENDHGTNVALVAAAARNDSGIVGTAFDAQVLALRADMPGTCGTDSPQDASLGCQFADSDIARGIDQAIVSGASVINLSLGGGRAAPVLLDALSRAADAGIVVVIAAGNEGDGSDPAVDPNQPNDFAADAVAAGNGNVIIVGSVNANGQISDFSNRAGDFSSTYLTARGERICCVYDEGELFVETIGGSEFVTLFSGTSFSTPQVAGAVALLSQAFPNLTAPEIVEILLTTARDVGASGDDAIYGTGILDIAAAFSPIGVTSVPGSNIALSLGSDFATGSAAMGDALRSASLSTVVLDRYDRAFDVELGANQARDPAQIQRLRGAVERGTITRSASGSSMALAVTIGEGQRAAGLGWTQELQLTPEEAEGARVLAARIAAQIAPDTQFGFAIAQGAKGLMGQLQGAEQAAFTIAPSAGGDMGFTESSDVAFAVRQSFGAWGVTIAGERGRAWLPNNRRFEGGIQTQLEQLPTSSLSLALDRSFGALDADIGLTWLAERDTLLGGHFSQGLGIEGGDTLFLDAHATQSMGRHWRIGANLRTGVTRPRGSALVAEGSRLVSQAWSFDAIRGGVFKAGDTLGLRISQPLRVSAGGLDFDLPVAYDYASETAILGRQRLDLTPEGREIMSELAWGLPVWGGYARASAFHRRQPGHFATAPDDVGAVVSFNATF
ncbi:MAG: S8 family peptidase [Pseudomonadota bacterium]